MDQSLIKSQPICLLLIKKRIRKTWDLKIIWNGRNFDLKIPHFLWFTLTTFSETNHSKAKNLHNLVFLQEKKRQFAYPIFSFLFFLENHAGKVYCMHCKFILAKGITKTQ